jgi:hypothetical protein
MLRPGAQPINFEGQSEPPAELPDMFWSSFDLVQQNNNLYLDTKNNPILIGPISGQIRLRNTRSSIEIYHPRSASFGPGMTNPIGGTVSSDNSIVYGVENVIEVRVFTDDPLQANNGDWMEIKRYTPTAGGPFEFPIVNIG